VKQLLGTKTKGGSSNQPYFKFPLQKSFSFKLFFTGSLESTVYVLRRSLFYKQELHEKAHSLGQLNKISSSSHVFTISTFCYYLQYMSRRNVSYFYQIKPIQKIHYQYSVSISQKNALLSYYFHIPIFFCCASVS
jgi:hypothetical protein